MTNLDFETAVMAISKLVVAYNCTEIEAITKMQGAAAKAGDDASLEALCEIKGKLIEQLMAA